MKVEYDRKVDAVYIYLQQKQVAKTIELSDVVKIDLPRSILRRKRA